MKTTVIALALLLTACGGGPQATAPPAPAVPASPTATVPPAAAPAAPAAASGASMSWGTYAVAGGSMLNERPDKGCELIRQAARIRAMGQAASDESAALANKWGEEVLQLHGGRCGVR